MTVNTINYTVEANGVTPAVIKSGGVQGDHNVTKLVFSLPQSFVDVLFSSIPEGEKIYYRFDGYSGANVMRSTEAIELTKSGANGVELSYFLENWITKDGGNVVVNLVLVHINTDVETESELYCFPVSLSLKARIGRAAYNEAYKGVTSAELAAKEAAENAKKSADSAAEKLEEFKNFEKLSIDQIYNPTSTNAQSGVAVAQAIDNRTVYQKFIDGFNLKQRNWVDLSFVGGTYYYTDFADAVTDINSGHTKHSTTTSTDAVCQVFKNKEITVLRLLKDITVTSEIIFTKSLILDINGFSVSLSGDGVFGNEGRIKDLTIIYYGAKENSKITSTNVYSAFLVNSQYTYFLGGKYYSFNDDAPEAESDIMRFIVESKSNGAFDCVLEIVNCDMQMESSSIAYEPIGIHIGRSETATDKIDCLVSNSKIIATNTNEEAKEKLGAFALWCDDTSNAIRDLVVLKCINSKIEGLGKECGTNYTAEGMGVYCSCRATFENCEMLGIHSGISVGNSVCELKNCICASPGHGGIYTQTGAIVYIDGCEFYHRAINGVTIWNSSGAYFTNGSISYINNSAFITDVNNGDVITLKSSSADKHTKVYISNSSTDNIRVDAGQLAYLGNRISDALKSKADNIKIFNTEENYTSDNNNYLIVDNNHNPQSRNAQSGIAVEEAIKSKLFSLELTFGNANADGTFNCTYNTTSTEIVNVWLRGGMVLYEGAPLTNGGLAGDVLTMSQITGTYLYVYTIDNTGKGTIKFIDLLG